ncbi:unnamed protein product [Symbiodinium sp. CCMP2592]|nr:unnamed protein product [Symbiodinium sp. CCMP2592]
MEEVKAHCRDAEFYDLLTRPDQARDLKVAQPMPLLPPSSVPRAPTTCLISAPTSAAPQDITSNRASQVPAPIGQQTLQKNLGQDPRVRLHNKAQWFTRHLPAAVQVPVGC